MSVHDAARLLEALSTALTTAFRLPPPATLPPESLATPHVPPTPIPSPRGGGEALSGQPPAPTPPVTRFPPPSWGREREGEDEEARAVRYGLAVSGGGDSLAMLHLSVAAGLRPHVATVDHGLRPEAASEAAWVGHICAGLGLPHDVLRWHWDGKGNLQDAARRGRRQVLAAWAQERGLDAVALAHTSDDLAETFLMRLARGAGVDGMSAMSGAFADQGMLWLRPMRHLSRAELRAWLAARGLTWVEDPSNDNLRFDRIRLRKAMPTLAGLGLTVPRLTEVAHHMTQARQALEAAADRAAPSVLAPPGNAIRIDPAALGREAPEVQRRLLQRLLAHLAPGDYGPRGAALQALILRLAAMQPAQLAGCRFLPDRKQGCLWAFREGRAVASLACPAGQPWDGQWRILGPAPQAAETRALGQGIAHCPDWRATGLPRLALMSSPALWLGARLIAAPHAGFGPEFSAIPLRPADALHHSPLSH